MFTNFYVEMRSANLKTMLAAAGTNRVELLTPDLPTPVATMDWADVAGFVPTFFGYEAVDVNPLDMTGPVFIDGHYVIATPPLLFVEEGDGVEAIDVAWAAWVLTIDDGGGPVDHLVGIFAISPAVPFEFDGDSIALVVRLKSEECDGDTPPPPPPDDALLFTDEDPWLFDDDGDVILYT